MSTMTEPQHKFVFPCDDPNATELTPSITLPSAPIMEQPNIDVDAEWTYNPFANGEDFRVATPTPADLQKLQDELDGDLPCGRTANHYGSGRHGRTATPIPVDLQKLQDELNHNLQSDAPDESAGANYDLRKAARLNQRLGLPWLDQDKSGTYDPATEFQRRLPHLQLKRKREMQDSDADGAPRKPRYFGWQHGRSMGQQLLVTLKVTSEKGKAWLKSFGSALDNEPKLFWYDGRYDEGTVHWADAMDATFDDSDCLDQGPYKLRKRKGERLKSLHTFHGCGEPDLADITVGHPAARGCKACLALGSWCPLLEEGSKYPCEMCVDDDIDCELVIEPARKSRCERCRMKRISCSYVEDGSDHTRPCQHCANSGLKCVAGPASGRTRTGPSLDQVFMRAPEDDRTVQKRKTMKGCNQCSRAKKWCSLKNKNPSVPCKYCLDNGMTCTFEPVRRRIANSKRREEKGTQPRVNISSNTKPTSASKAIRTRLAHPINFNYEPVEGDFIAPCHWCDDLIYGLLGLGEREIEVQFQDNDAGKGYIEIDDGHVAAGFTPSRMCEYCTIDRIRVLSCRNHEIQPIEGMDPEEFDYSAIMDAFEPGKAASASFDWCSICPTPAFFACGTKDDIGGEMEELDLQDTQGCGLMLCESCAVSLVNDHDCHLDGLLDRLKMDEEDGGFNFRADADFLHSQGELMRRMRASQ